VDFFCIQCRLPEALCLCAECPVLDLKTRVVIFPCQSELNKLSNTGVLARQVLTNSTLVVRGQRNKKPITQEDFGAPALSSHYLVYPKAEAQVLDDKFVSSQKTSVTLVFPDGHWGQTQKMIHHEPSLKMLPRLKLPDGLLSQYRLRRNIIAGRVCTFEAIMLALGVIEGAHVQDQMQQVFEKKITRILWLRGKIAKAEIK
jgi:DTW domain-containing protein YfiP